MRKSDFREVPDIVHSAVLDALGSLDDTIRGDGPKREKSVHSERQTLAINDAGDNDAVLTGNKKQKNFQMPKIAAVGIACFLIAGVSVSAMGVINLYRQRLEEMDKAEIEEYYTIALAGEVNSLNRPYTAEERERYERLEEEYKTNGLFPESQMRIMAEGDVYDGIGVAMDVDGRTLYLPEETLTDEELLEIIDFNLKLEYSIYEINEERIINGGGWESRMAQMDDAEVDRIYLITCSANTEVSGGYSRMFTEDEKSRYEELVRCYEEEGLYTTSELTVIWKPEEYTGEGVAVCVADSNYYFPETELTDEELLQLIDFQHKARCIFDRISDDIRYGRRDGYPPTADIE